MSTLDQVRQIVDNASSIPHEEIVSRIADLLSRESKSNCISLARSLDIPGSFRSKQDVIDCITSVAVDRRFTSGRTQF